MLNKNEKVYIQILGIIVIAICVYISYRRKSNDTFEGFFEFNRGLNEDVGFIVTRCVKKAEQNTLYEECYKAIRKYHPDLKIVFIDDNSDKNILKEIPMNNVEIIQSEFPGAGEYLPYYYLLTRRFFKKAIIIQDSMIINTAMPYKTVNDYAFMYEFDNDDHEDTIKTILNNTKIPDKLLYFYNNFDWVGCFGGCMIITRSFLEEIEDTIKITGWVNLINTREYRMGFERTIAIACIYMNRNKTKYSLFGSLDDIYVCKNYGYGNFKISNYLTDKETVTDPIIKIWNGR